MPEHTVTLAHLSDVHLGPLPPIPWPLLNLKRATGWFNWHRTRKTVHLPKTAGRIADDVSAQQPTHIAVGGDMANLGLPAEIERAAVWLRRLGAAADVSVVPGNHDIYARSGGRTLGVDALVPWRAYFTADAEGQKYAGASAFPFVRVVARGRTRVALIGLNSAVETAPGIATGRLGAEQRADLARILSETRRDGLVRVVMLHHPPLPGGADPHHELTDAADLADILRTSGAELVLHGHNHRRSVTPFHGPDGTFAIVGVPSASVGRNAPKGEPLARAHYFNIRSDGDAPAHIELVARGLAEPDGPIIELERTRLDRPSLGRRSL